MENGFENTEQSEDTSRRSKRLRFSLKALLALAFVVAICLGAFRFGREQGFEEGNRIGFAEGLNAKVYPVTYRVADLTQVSQKGTNAFFELADLIKEIETDVQPTSWEAVGGPATMAPYPQNLSLVISQTDKGHDDLSAFLEAKRTGLKR
ncbi:MAG: hypothetical protein WBD20_02580 [Pirellulaceae bacterium]